MLEFASKYRSVTVSGRDRNRACVLVADALFEELLEREAYTKELGVTNDEWGRNLVTGMTLTATEKTLAGRKRNVLLVALNTALRKGPDALRLAARFHAQCELHAYVEGPNRGWLANLIESTCQQGLFLQDWHDVLDLLRASSDGPVVSSYSICPSFPDLDIVERAGLWKPTLPSGLSPSQYEDAYTEAWDNEPEAWEIAMQSLRKVSATWDHQELTPDDFSSYAFGDGGSIYDL